MKIQIQEYEIDIINLGVAVENHGVVKREVTFEINGKPFRRTIILGVNGTGADYQDPEKFYIKNKKEVDASLREYISEHHFYTNKK